MDGRQRSQEEHGVGHARSNRRALFAGSRASDDTGNRAGYRNCVSKKEDLFRPILQKPPRYLL
jgi:hypothetical protein